MIMKMSITADPRHTHYTPGRRQYATNVHYQYFGVRSNETPTTDDVERMKVYDLNDMDRRPKGNAFHLNSTFPSSPRVATPSSVSEMFPQTESVILNPNYSYTSNSSQKSDNAVFELRF